MTFGQWLIIFFIFILIVFIILWIAWSIRNNQPPTQVTTDTNLIPNVWTKSVKGPDNNKNQCTLYTFPPVTLTIDGQTYNSLGTPTFDSDILNNLDGQVNYRPPCLDADQIFAQQLQHTCTGTEGSLIKCPLQNGGTTGVGGVEVFYSNIDCGTNLMRCVGSIASISINYQVPRNTDIYCITNPNIQGNNVYMSPCDQTNMSQVFRVTRTQIGTNPASLSFGEGQYGILGQILDRVNNKCLTAGDDDATISIYDSNYQNDTQCSGNPVQVFGTNTIFSDCQKGPYPGYEWLFLPSVRYRPDPDVNQFLVTPPQITYIGDIDVTSIPPISDPDALIAWLKDQNVRSLYFGGFITDPMPFLILAPFATDIDDCEQKPYTAQYLNLTNYSTIVNQPVCIQEVDVDQAKCVPL